jgi:hypothetical protein
MGFCRKYRTRKAWDGLQEPGENEIATNSAVEMTRSRQRKEGWGKE